MATQNEHGKLIAAAAKATLAPIGCKRLGQSRTWISDQGFYAIVIEFQPSGWSKGSYLNVGACWLWHISRSWTFDEGYRVADFIPFENAAQFTPLIAKMAERAAEEVSSIRARFKTLTDVARILVSPGPHGSARDFNAAIAAGVVGDMPAARSLFTKYEARVKERAWFADFSARHATLTTTVNDPARFRRAAQEIIDKMRGLHRLPPAPDCLERALSPASR